MTGRLSYREFKDEFLLNFAVMAQGEIGKFINPIDAVKDIQERYSPTGDECSRGTARHGISVR